MNVDTEDKHTAICAFHSNQYTILLLILLSFALFVKIMNFLQIMKILGGIAFEACGRWTQTYDFHSHGLKYKQPHIKLKVLYVFYNKSLNISQV